MSERVCIPFPTINQCFKLDDFLLFRLLCILYSFAVGKSKYILYKIIPYHHNIYFNIYIYRDITS